MKTKSPNGLGARSSLVRQIIFKITPATTSLIFMLVISFTPVVFGFEVLKQSQLIVENEDESLGLVWSRHSAVSADGKHLYVLGGPGGSLVVFDRSQSDGLIAHSKTYWDGNGVVGENWLNGARTIALTPSGKFLILGCYQGIHMFERDPTTGELNSIQRIQNGWWAAEGISWVSDVITTSNNRYIYTSSSAESSISIFQIDSETSFISFVGTHKNGIDGVTGIDQAMTLRLSPDELFLYTSPSGLLANQYPALFSRDPDTGQLSFINTNADVPPSPAMGGIDSILTSPDGKSLYLAAHNSGTSGPSLIRAYSRDSTNGQLSFLSDYPIDDEGPDNIDQYQSLLITPDGKFVFSVRGSVDQLGVKTYSILVFRRSQLTGELTFVEELINGNGEVTGLDGLVSISLSPDGRNLYATSANDKSVVVFSLINLFSSGFE